MRGVDKHSQRRCCAYGGRCCLRGCTDGVVVCGWSDIWNAHAGIALPGREVAHIRGVVVGTWLLHVAVFCGGEFLGTGVGR